MFVTVLNDGIDTIIKRQSGSPFTGRMRIINEKGYIKGEVYLLKGQLHGEEIIFNKTGEISERIFWDNGRQIDQ
jgi:antitoxin component YwqK of YwqJK toxin-antitoxin module